MTFRGIVHAGMVLIPPELDLPDGTVVQIEASIGDPASGPANDRAAEELRRLQELRKEIAFGIEQLDRGDYDDFDDASLAEFFERVKAEGRRRLAGNHAAPSS